MKNKKLLITGIILFLSIGITLCLPKKESGLTLSKESKCNNGVTIKWDDNNWSALINYENFIPNENQRTTCYLYFEKKEEAILRSVEQFEMDGLWEYKASISKIIIQNELKPIENAIREYDESAEQDKSVMSYIVENESAPSTYTAYLQSNGKLFLNPNSSNLFLIFRKLETIEGMENIDTSKVTNMSAMFGGCDSLNSIDISHFNTINVTDMNSMFIRCRNLTSLDLKSFDTTNVTNMNGMFKECNSLTSIDLSSLKTENVLDMGHMFYGCSSLTSLDLTYLKTEKVTNMSSMFYECSSLTSLDLSHFNTKNVSGTKSEEGFECMFQNASKLTNIVYGNNFIYSNSTNVTNMFTNCPTNKPTHSSWDGIL